MVNKEELCIYYDEENQEITFDKIIKPTNDLLLIVKIQLGKKPTNDELNKYIDDVKDIILKGNSDDKQRKND